MDLAFAKQETQQQTTATKSATNPTSSTSSSSSSTGHGHGQTSSSSTGSSRIDNDNDCTISSQQSSSSSNTTASNLYDHHHINLYNHYTDNKLRKISSDSFGSESIFYIDPSEHFRPEHKSAEEYRIYTTNQDDYIQKRVFETYRLMHTNQTLDFALDRLRYWTRFDKLKLGIMDALEKLNCLVDESDPDVDLPNIVHAFQTAERIREAHPDLDWFHLTGLIHDLGKIMAIYGEPQWAVVGDTFPLGCSVAPSVVYREETFDENVDMKNDQYNTEYGIYKPNCGLKDVVMSWGHDEYMYQVLKNHKTCTLPEQAFYIIRFHSFYPWHTGGDYYHLCSKHDLAMLPWIREFNKFDLYSKTPEIPDIPKLIPYYQSLIDEYIPGLVDW